MTRRELMRAAAAPLVGSVALTKSQPVARVAVSSLEAYEEAELCRLTVRAMEDGWRIANLDPAKIRRLAMDALEVQRSLNRAAS